MDLDRAQLARRNFRYSFQNRALRQFWVVWVGQIKEQSLVNEKWTLEGFGYSDYAHVCHHRPLAHSRYWHGEAPCLRSYSYLAIFVPLESRLFV